MNLIVIIIIIEAHTEVFWSMGIFRLASESY